MAGLGAIASLLFSRPNSNPQKLTTNCVHDTHILLLTGRRHIIALRDDIVRWLYDTRKGGLAPILLVAISLVLSRILHWLPFLRTSSFWMESRAGFSNFRGSTLLLPFLYIPRYDIDLGGYLVRPRLIDFPRRDCGMKAYLHDKSFLTQCNLDLYIAHYTSQFQYRGCLISSWVETKKKPATTPHKPSHRLDDSAHIPPLGTKFSELILPDDRSDKMVYYFTSTATDPPAALYVGKDKTESRPSLPPSPPANPRPFQPPEPLTLTPPDHR